MERWRTAHRSDPDFSLLLRGTLAPGFRSLPRRSLNVGGAAEEVTFELVPLEEIERPHALAIALHALRPATLILSLGPLLASLAHLEWSLRRPVDWVFAGFALFGVLLFHASLNLLNDYADHMSGADRVHSLGGSRAIQRGWARAASFRAWGLGLFASALFVGLALAIERPVTLLLLGACAIGAAYYLTWGKTRGRRILGVREAATFALGGPLLACGFVAAAAEDSAAAVAASTLCLGCAFGFSALLYGTLGNVESIMRDSLSGAGTLAARLGFDRSKSLISASAILATAFAMAYAALSGAFLIVLPMAIGCALAAFYAANAAVRAKSPLSSALRGARNRALWAHWAIALGTVACLAALNAFGAALGLVP